jgi:hypothetical protein
LVVALPADVADVFARDDFAEELESAAAADLAARTLPFPGVLVLADALVFAGVLVLAVALAFPGAAARSVSLAETFFLDFFAFVAIVSPPKAFSATVGTGFAEENATAQ